MVVVEFIECICMSNLINLQYAMTVFTTLIKLVPLYFNDTNIFSWMLLYICPWTNVLHWRENGNELLIPTQQLSKFTFMVMSSLVKQSHGAVVHIPLGDWPTTPFKGSWTHNQPYWLPPSHIFSSVTFIWQQHHHSPLKLSLQMFSCAVCIHPRMWTKNW